MSGIQIEIPRKTFGGTGAARRHEIEEVVITDEDIRAVTDQGRKDPIVIALAGKAGTCKSGVLCEFISRLPEGKVCPVLDFDHSITQIIETFWPSQRDKFYVINATAFGKDYKKGLKVGLAALEKFITENRDRIGLLASEGMDRLLQRSFKITCQARGYNIEDLRFFGKGGDVEFTPTDWMIRNDYNVDPFDLLYNYAAELGVDLILSTHTEDEIDNRRVVVEQDKPMWFKTIPDYLCYLFIMTKKEDAEKVERIATCKKSRIQPQLDGKPFQVQLIEKKTPPVIKFPGLYETLKKEGVPLHF